MAVASTPTARITDNNVTGRRIVGALASAPLDGTVGQQKPFFLPGSPFLAPGHGVDSDAPNGEIYQRNSELNVPTTSDGRERRFTTLGPNEISGKPRTWRNELAGVDITDVSNWSTSNADIDYSHADEEYSITSLSGGTSDEVSIKVTVANLEGLDHRAICYLKALAIDDIGKNVELTCKRVSGGSVTSETTVVTLTDSYTPYTTQILTGVASNVNVMFRIRGASSNAASDCLMKYPTIVNMTGWGNQEPVAPMPVDTPVGPELIASTTSEKWFANGTNTITDPSDGIVRITHVDNAAGATVFLDDDEGALNIAALILGKRYVLQGEARVNTGSVDLQVFEGDGSSPTVDSGSPIISTTFVPWRHTFTASTNAAVIALNAYNMGTGEYIELQNISIKEATTGLGESNETNQNISLGGIVHDEELHWLELEGLSGDRAEYPHVDFAGDAITVEWTGALDDWAANNQGLVTQYTAASEKEFVLYSHGGRLSLGTSSNGSTDVISTSELHGISNGTLHTVRVEWDSATNLANYYLDGVQVGASVSHVDGELHAGTANLIIGAWTEGGAGRMSGKTVSAKVYNGVGDSRALAISFDAETAIADGWTIHSGGTAQIKTNKALPLHRLEKFNQSGVPAVDQYAVYEHFPLSESIALDDFYISTLANATTPNGSQGIFNRAASLPNLIPPAARVDFSEWTQTGTGSITPVGDGVELFTDANATSITNETNATTGWIDQGASTLNPIANVHGQGGAYALRMDANGSPAGRAYVDLEDRYALTPGFFYTITLECVWISGNPASYGCGASSAGTNSFNNSITSTAGIQSFTNTFFYSGDSRYIHVRESGGSNDSVVDILSVTIQKRSHTILSDEDNTASECYWSLDVAIPTDNQAYTLPLSLSEGTALATTVRARWNGVSAKDSEWKYTWATGVLEDLGSSAADTSASISVNADGTLALEVNGTDDASNNILSIIIFPATADASIQGTVAVHGDVALNRVSVAAEPDWNTLKPGDSVEQYVLQQNDPNTTWALANAPVIVTGLADPKGETNAFSLEDDNAATVESINQTNMDLGASSGDVVRCATFVKKTVGANFASLRITDVDDSSTWSEVIIDTNNGFLTERSAGVTPSSMVIVDGASLTTMFPYAEDWWYVEISQIAVSADNYKIDLAPTQANVFDGGSDAAATGVAVFYAPSVWVGGSFFFDSLATTATVTEVIQDWSKIFTFVTEASNNACNMVFDHGFHCALGIPNSVSLTNEQPTPFNFHLTGTDWGVQNTATLTDAISIIPGQTAVRVTSDTSQFNFNDVFGTLTGAQETTCVWVETAPTTDTLSLFLRDEAAGVTRLRTVFDFSTFAWTDTLGTKDDGGYIPLGKGPNGGDLYLLWIKDTTANAAAGRRTYIYPNGVGTLVSGTAIIVHAFGSYESSKVSISPVETSTAHQTWIYAEDIPDHQGTMRVDLIPMASHNQLPTSQNVVSATRSLYIAGNSDVRTYDGTVVKSATGIFSATDVIRNVISWSDAENEHTIRTASDNGNSEDAVDVSYDGSFSPGDLEMFQNDGFEVFLLNFVMTKKFSDGLGRSAEAAYD